MFMVNHLIGFGVLVDGPPLDGVSGLTGAWSMSRKLLTSYGGSFYTDAGGGAISALLDQSGNTRNLSQGTGASRPTAATAGSKSRACADFDGSDDLLTGTTMSNFISAGAGYVVVSALIDAISTNNATADQNDSIFSDSGANIGIALKSGTPSALAYNWDGATDSAEVTISSGVAHVFEWRHEGGTLYLRIDGGTEASVSSGNTASMSASIIMGRNYFNQYFDGKVFEAAAFSTVPALATRNAIVADMLAWAA